MLSWEFPPVVVGGLGRHVHQLSTALVAAGHQVTVVTRHAPGAPVDEYVEGVRVVRAPEDPPLFPLSTPSLLAWTMAFNHALTRAALRAADGGEYDLIHAHDWLVAHTAITLKEHLRLPLVATIHATEAGRHQGWLPGDMNKCIHSIEYWLGHEADRVLVCSGYMRWEVSRLLELTAGKVEVVPNGVDAAAWRPAPRAVAAARSRYAGEGPLLGFAGRLVYEKGVQDLVAALPRLRAAHPGARLVIAGDGPHQQALRDEVHDRRLQRAVSFAGFLGDDELPAVLAAMDTVVVPSIYEPFGMVALEAAAAGAPLAVTATGGLTEIVTPEVTGMTFPARDPDRLADAVGSLLADPSFAATVAHNARTMVAEKYSWATVARRTVEAYGGTLRRPTALAVAEAADAAATNGDAAAANDAAAMVARVVRPRIVVPEGNLLSL
ncbi:glycosyltransferase family 4 protein [Planosporangium thailandense]|uniref:Glycosyltransferase family 4 protein n=1 Tax=Planosporangium thailandense TaxID=765197 RepID=A0ABX0XUT9_9ACTN|nr:glycosyltransferase family 4 protein [Planosporangium thailandense]NJC69782.1 glycosyltransferase family 4 protein [Planosporangium thailandense]